MLLTVVALPSSSLDPHILSCEHFATTTATAGAAASLVVTATTKTSSVERERNRRKPDAPVEAAAAVAFMMNENGLVPDIRTGSLSF